AISARDLAALHEETDALIRELMRRCAWLRLTPQRCASLRVPVKTEVELARSGIVEPASLRSPEKVEDAPGRRAAAMTCTHLATPARLSTTLACRPQRVELAREPVVRKERHS